MECTICMNNVVTKYNHYKCNHVFHKKCISKWTGNCPNCRSNKVPMKKKSLLSFKKFKHVNIHFCPKILQFETIKQCYEMFHNINCFNLDDTSYLAICTNCNKSMKFNIHL